MLEYNSYVKHADDDLQAKKYSSARFYYGKAAGILSWENYPKNQLKIVEKLYLQPMLMELMHNI